MSRIRSRDRLSLWTTLLSGGAGLLLAAAAAGQAPPGTTAEALDRVAAQKAEADVRTALREAQRLTQADPVKAGDRLKKALAALERDTALPEARREALKRMLQDRIRGAEADADGAAAAAIDRDEKQTQAGAKRAADERRRADVEKVRQKQAEIRDLQKEGRTEEASRKADEFAQQRPDNPSAQATSQTSSAADRAAAARKLQADAERGRMAAIRDIDRALIIPKGEIEFPTDWKERTKGRNTGVQLTAKEKALVQALNTPISVSFRGSRLEDVIEYLQTFMGQTILLDKAALEEAQVTYDTPVTVNLRGVTVRTLLRKILGDLALAYVVRDETIQVTSGVRARDLMVVRSYYIGDLVIGMGGVNPIQQMQSVNQIMDMIQNSVDAPSWRVNGGSGTISFNAASMTLVVRQSAEVHAMLAGGLLK
jgi:hypothetical protein